MAEAAAATAKNFRMAVSAGGSSMAGLGVESKGTLTALVVAYSFAGQSTEYKSTHTHLPLKIDLYFRHQYRPSENVQSGAEQRTEGMKSLEPRRGPAGKCQTASFMLSLKWAAQGAAPWRSPPGTVKRSQATGIELRGSDISSLQQVRRRCF